MTWQRNIDLIDKIKDLSPPLTWLSINPKTVKMIEKGLTKNNGMFDKNTCHAVKKQLTWQTKPKTWLTRSNDLFNQNTWTNKSPGNETGEKIDKAVKIIWHVEPTSGLYNNNPWCLTIQMTRQTPTNWQGCHKEMTGLTKTLTRLSTPVKLLSTHNLNVVKNWLDWPMPKSCLTKPLTCLTPNQHVCQNNLTRHANNDDKTDKTRMHADTLLKMLSN